MRYLMTLLLLAALTAIGTTSAAQAQNKKIGVLWQGKSGMASRVAQGFTEQMKAKAPDIELEFKIELKDESELAPIYEEWQNTKNGIVFLRSDGASYMKDHPPKIPGFIGGSSNPEKLGVIKNMAAPEGNITGVTYYINARQRIDFFLKVFPNVKNLGLLVHEAHASSPIDREETKAACEALGITYHEALGNTEVEILKGAKELAGKVDLIVLGSQDMVNTHAPKIAGIVKSVPLVSYNPTGIKGNGAVLGMSPDDVRLGRMLADSVIAVVKEGKPISSVPVLTDPQPDLLVNTTMVDKLKLTIPEEILKSATLAK